MPDDRSKSGQRYERSQTEVNRQAMVSLGKRITCLEEKMTEMCKEIEDLHYYTASALETAKRLQGIVKQLLAKDGRSDS